MRTIRIADYRGAQEALRSGNLVQALYEEGGVVMDDTLISLHGAAHRKRRVTELAAFGREFFRRYEREIFPAALEQALAGSVQAGRADLVDFGYRVTMNLAADFAGIDRPRRSATETEQLLRLVRCFSEGATLVHSMRNHEEVRDEVRNALEEFDAVFLKPSRARRMAIVAAVEAGERRADSLPRDVITTLLRNREKLALPDDVFRREAAFYLQAGSHSTANSLTHAMHEILTWRTANPDDGKLLEQDANFLQRCVHESLRLHPASPVALRRAVCPVQLHDEIEEGDRVLIDLRAANRDPVVFGADADRFNPKRRLATDIWPFGLSFGYGAHACIGRDLDAGVVPRDGAPLEKCQLGIVTMLVKELLRHGADRDPELPPQPDGDTQRHNWASYPVMFRRPAREDVAG